MFYQEVFQSVLFFRADTWDLLEAMSRKLEGIRVGFLQKKKRQRAVQQKDKTWRQLAAKTVLEKACTQPLGTYIDRRQATVA